ncbi:conserved hypothetical protein [Paraburkholderia piptadeniae]|uniref:Uncharacterized protein n=1 Tax=Paraburkholderia piptadeniae TaxID=1701573 RepID=A0A1N7SUT8_9BURK|nr:hypothetical protein [Paraburkholderia piptadeniae]SIT51137.1 conserved hypothetical protein [Paraburkholderia piptadeniae]
MGIDDKHPVILKVLALEKKLQAAKDKGGEAARALRATDCAEARQAVEAARHTLPTIVYSTLLRRVEQCEQLLAQRGR